MRIPHPSSGRRSLALCALFLVGCGDRDPHSSSADVTSDVAEDPPDTIKPDAPDADDPLDGDTEEADATDADIDAAEVDVMPPPLLPGTDESRARAFQLFYRERVDRLLVAFNRFGVAGDTGWGLALRGALVAREGDAYDVVWLPSDNNLIGTPMRSIWYAWKHLGSTNAELTLIRLLRGLVFYEQVTGHPGLTSRMALPGWTLEIDGAAGTATRTRGGEPVTTPLPTDPDLEAAIIDAFFDGVTMRYRLDPRDSMLRFLPAFDPADYAITSSMPDLPRFIRRSDCCASVFRTPEGNTWADAWWSNHNSRDNFPDLALGLLTALEVEAAADVVSEAMLEAAEAVTVAGLRITDLIEASGGNIMTVDEWNPYDTLVISGVRRPHGLAESEALGGMSSCPMALLSRALSSTGLASEPEDLWLPGSPEYMITPEIEILLDCPYETPRACRSIDDAWCGYTWETIFDLQMLGQNWLDLARSMEASNPGSSGDLLGAFQNDYDDVVEAMVTLLGVLEVQGELALAAEVRTALGHMTRLMREFADIVYGATDPDRAGAQRYAAALFDAMGRRDVIVEDLDDFAIEEQGLARLEASLEIGPAVPAALYTDEELRQIVDDALAGLRDQSGPGRSDAIRERYAETYPDGDPPIRRAGDAYEARQGDGPWVSVERPRHRGTGNFQVFEALALCSTAPHLLDCSWARLGCAQPDLDDSGEVDAADVALLDAAFDSFGDGAVCTTGCDGADLDESGVLDGSDRAFMEAAVGCTYELGAGGS